jgi:hypothetical protein
MSATEAVATRRTRAVAISRRLPVGPPWLRALAFYVAFAVVTIGRSAITNPTGVCACLGNSDSATFMWALDWWPHAVVHGLNPFVTHYAWAPTGFNVTRSTTIPTAAFAMAPITALFGPIAAYNVLSILSPALSGFTAYLLCRRIAGRELPAVAGGYLFGFGTYQLAQLVGHINLTLVFLVPVAVLLALRRADGELSRRAYMVSLGAVFVLQAGLSTEVLASGVLLGIVMLVAARLWPGGPGRSVMNRLIGETFLAGFGAIVVASPFLYYALFNGSFPQGLPGLSDALGLDLLNPLFPTPITLFGSKSFASLAATFENANIAEADGYLSLPLIIAYVAWLATTRRRFLAGMSLFAAAVSLIAALGSHLHVAGQQTIALPYSWVATLPIFNFLSPSRFVMYTTLAVSVGVAAWLADRTGRSVVRWATVVLAIVAVYPNLPANYWNGAPANPAFFRDASLYRRYLTRGETALLLPYSADDNSLLWQAETGFYFSMPEGYFGNVAPPPFDHDPIVNQLGGGMITDTAAFLRFLSRYHVRDIIIRANQAGAFPAEFASLALRPVTVGGVLLYRIPAVLTSPQAS